MEYYLTEWRAIPLRAVLMICDGWSIGFKLILFKKILDRVRS